jgi:AhpD family alkylhydroperoxidase
MSEVQRLKYAELAPQGMAALSGVEHYLNTASMVKPVLLELVRLRASLMNGCEYCVGLHSHELRKHNEPVERIIAVARWRESDAFTEQERAALQWAEVVTDIQEGHASEEEFAALQVHFSDVEVVNLTLAISSMNAWNRMAIVFRPSWNGPGSPFAVGEVKA